MNIRSDSASVRQSIVFSSEKDVAWLYLELADTCYKRLLHDSVAYYAGLAFPQFTNHYEKRNYYRILINAATIQNEYKMANDYMYLYMTYNDSINKQENQLLFNAVKEMYDMRMEMNKVKKNGWIFSFAMIILIAVCAYVGSWCWYKAKKQLAVKKEQDEEELKIKAEQTAKEHRAKMRDDVLARIRGQQKAQNTLRKKMSFLERNEEDIKILKNELHYDKPNVFFQKMNRLFNNLLEHIKQNYSKLSDENIMYCCLLLIGLDSHEIALIFNIKEESARKMKQRLIKKMNFETSAEFESYLNQFL